MNELERRLADALHDEAGRTRAGGDPDLVHRAVRGGRRRRRRRRAATAAVPAVLVVGAVAVVGAVLPLDGGSTDVLVASPSASAPPTPGGEVVTTRVGEPVDEPPGAFDWPLRGDEALAADVGASPAAAWSASRSAADAYAYRPLWAGEVDGTPYVLGQAWGDDGSALLLWRAGDERSGPGALVAVVPDRPVAGADPAVDAVQVPLTDDASLVLPPPGTQLRAVGGSTAASPRPLDGDAVLLPGCGSALTVVLADGTTAGTYTCPPSS